MSKNQKMMGVITLAASLGMLALGALPAGAAMQWVPVGNPGNAAEGETGFGAVAYKYNISKYEVNNTQYTAFLNAVATVSDPYALYSTLMDTSPRGGITRSGDPGSYTYATKTGMEKQPLFNNSWHDSIRLANWMTGGATESGSYTITGGGPNSGTVVVPDAAQRAAWAGAGEFHVMLANDDEWYKAAYYDAGSASYYDYPTGSNTEPTAVASGTDSNTAVFGGGAVTGPADVDNCGGLSPYGTMGQGGNMFEWLDTELANPAIFRARGGAFYWSGDGMLHTWYIDTEPKGYEFNDMAMRMTSVPEPASLSLLLLGLPFVMRRKRK